MRSIESATSTNLPARTQPKGVRLGTALRSVVLSDASPKARQATEPILVSIIIPTYQHRGMVREVVAAALVQESTVAFEVVVVDDGSTDGTEQEMLHLVRQTAGRLHYLRLGRNAGRAVARNAGIAVAQGSILAFTDSDCVPVRGWLEAGRQGFQNPKIGIIQGPTRPHPGQPRPFFNHFIEIDRFDGTFSTCNIFYRREAILAVDGFDPSIVYWEDLDLGWRVRRAGWEATYAPTALVYHQVMPISPLRWLRWPLHYQYMPAKTARYPEYRRFLFLGMWVHWYHLLADLAILSILLGLRANRRFFALSLPYLIAFPFQHGIGGRWPPVKAAFHLAWDVLSFVVLATNSFRYRSFVL